MTRLLLLGHGRMGQLVERLAAAHGCEIAGVVSSRSGPDAIRTGDFGSVDVAIDFTQPSAVAANFRLLAARKVNVVLGTTGWQGDEVALRDIAAQAGIGVLASANFSLGMAVFRAIVREAAQRFGPLGDVGAWIHESHHAAKKDAPSGTALMLKSAMEQAAYPRPVDVSSTRAGSIPGTMSSASTRRPKPSRSCTRCATAQCSLMAPFRRPPGSKAGGAGSRWTRCWTI